MKMLNQDRENELVNFADQGQIVYDLAVTDDNSTRMVYYITDIHLEHQLKQIASNGEMNFKEVREFIKKKLDELIPKEHTIHDTLLIGGDVASSFRLTTLFYRELLRFWKGKIISILGNHELWNIQPENRYGEYRSKPLDRIIDEYRKEINLSGYKLCSVLLQNAIYILYKNTQDRVFEENQILDASDEELRNICSKSTLIILGGIGFSGLDSHHNAESGLYKFTVTTREEDMELSKRFYLIYSKLNRCAGDKQVIVLTHTPVHNWTSDPYNPNWVYINGHTHQNSLIRKQDGTTVLSDNQVGYKPTRWRLKGFTVAGWYDPFRGMEDGIHEITNEQYKDFNLGRGIPCKGCNYAGKIFALKRNGLYMFLLRTKSNVCLLDGGQRKKLHRTPQYYYENIERYVQKIQETLSPYRNVLEIISQETKKFGGRGTIHGCIVDIDSYCHVYLNPFDGKITPYFARDTSFKLTYDDISSLLKRSDTNLYDQFIAAYNNGLIPLLSQYAAAKGDNIKQTALATVPELVLDTAMYEPSNIMRSFQYVWDSNIIRIWKDEILTADFSKLSQNSAIEEKPKQITNK